MEIRVLGESDAEAWWHLRRLALQDEPHSFAESMEEHEAKPIQQAREFFRENGPDNFVVGYFEDGQLAGMAGFYREKHAKFRHKGTIWGVYVRRESRRKGVARAVLNEIIGRVRTNPGIEQILLIVAATQDKARSLYEALGFRKYGVEPRSLKIGSEYVDDELMVLFLDSNQP